MCHANFPLGFPTHMRIVINVFPNCGLLSVIVINVILYEY